MEIYKTLPILSSNEAPVTLTIGNFDGVHLGHQALINHTIAVAKQAKEKSALITFSSHPQATLNPSCPIPLLCTTEQKIKLLSNSGIDELYILDFTQEFSLQSAEDFLQYLQAHMPFSNLILGADAHLGKDRKGDRPLIEEIAKRLNFNVEYFPDYTVDGSKVSSGTIRRSIASGKFDEAKHLLGRPYTIFGPVLIGSGRGVAMGFPTIDVPLDSLSTPPAGVYAVSVESQNTIYRGVANLSHPAPPKAAFVPVIEVHLLDPHLDLHGHFVSIQFMQFIRPEKRFDNLDDLKLQIARDVLAVNQLTLN